MDLELDSKKLKIIKNTSISTSYSVEIDHTELRGLKFNSPANRNLTLITKAGQEYLLTYHPLFWDLGFGPYFYEFSRSEAEEIANFLKTKVLN
jgi:hypothetical protein